MFYLILQMLFLLALAAALGAWIAWWLFRRHYVDVTSEFDRLSGIGELVGNSKQNILNREDALKNFSDLREDMKGIRMPDMTPMQERLIRLESMLGQIRIPEPNLNPLHERFARVETRLNQDLPQLQATNQRLAMIEQGLNTVMKEIEPLSNTDLRPVIERLDRVHNAIDAMPVPEVDLTPINISLIEIQEQLEDMRNFPAAADIEPHRVMVGDAETRLASFIDVRDTSRKNDLENIQIRLTTISSALAGIKGTDLTPVQDRLSRIETAIQTIEPADTQGVINRIAHLEQVLGAVQIPETDLTPVTNRLTQLENLLTSIRVPETDLTPIASRLARLEHLLTSIRLPETDLAPISTRLSRLESLISSIRVPETDLAPVEERLRFIEGLMRAPNEDMRIFGAKLEDLDGGTATVLSRISGIEAALGDMDRTGDFQELSARLANVDAAVSALRMDLKPVPDIAPIERRLTSIQSTLENLRLNEGTRSRPQVADPVPVAIPPLPPTRTVPLVDPDRLVSTSDLDTRIRARTTPLRTSDALATARRTDDRANLLTHAAFGEGDELEVISGIGPLLQEMLNGIGVYYFWQIADWGPEEVEWVDDKLDHFKGRIVRDNWVTQAKDLARRPGAARRPG